MAGRARLAIELDPYTLTRLRRMALHERRTLEDEAAVLLERLIETWRGAMPMDQWLRRFHADGAIPVAGAPAPLEEAG
jgi:hypothetical protein